MGGKGLQLYADISDLTAEQASALAKGFAERLERTPRPGGVANDEVPARRQGAHRLVAEQRLQDHRRALLAARQEHPTASTPVSWDEVAACRTPQDLFFTAPDVLARVGSTATCSPPCCPYRRLRHYRRVVANITMYDTIYNNQFPQARRRTRPMSTAASGTSRTTPTSSTRSPKRSV